MENLWSLCLSTLQQELPPQQFNTWIKPLCFAETQDTLLIIAPNRFIQQRVQSIFLLRIKRFFEKHAGKPPAIEVVLENDTVMERPLVALKTRKREVKPTKSPFGLDTSFSLENYVTGKANQLAYAAAIQVAENLGKVYNPLFIYGGSGLGKTHLMNAIGLYTHQLNPKINIRFIHTKNFINQIVSAYTNKSFNKFRSNYDNVDLLLVDDIYFMGGKNGTQEEFFTIFNNFTGANKQIIITNDTYPKEIHKMDERLRTRFCWGLTVAIETPEIELRVAILLKKAQQESIDLKEDVAFFIAQIVNSNVRELEGALKSVIARAKFYRSPVSLDIAKEALQDLMASHGRQTHIENIQKTVADYFKVKMTDMYSQKRSKNIVRPRQFAMYLARELTSLSFTEIGEAFGKKHHTTVIHACEEIEKLRKTDPNLNKEFALLRQIIMS